MPIEECGALLPRNAAVHISSPKKRSSSPLSAGLNSTKAAGVLPARSGILICRDILVLAYASKTPVRRQ